MQPKSTKQTILIFDLALKNTGWAVFCEEDYISSGVLTISGKTTEDRFAYMSYEIVEILNEVSPDLVYVECTYKGAKYNVLDPIIRLQRVIKDWCEKNAKENAFRRISPDAWRRRLSFPERLKKSKELKQYSVDNVKQYLKITVTDDEADAINIGRAITQKRGLPPQSSTTQKNA